MKENETNLPEIERIFSTAAHDLKNSLVSITSYTDMLFKEYGEKLDEDGRFIVKRISANASAMESIAQGLLEYTKIGRTMDTWSVIQTCDVVMEIAESYALLFRERNISFRIENPLPDVYFFDSGLRRVFINLIDNAVKYTRKDARSYIKTGVIDPGESNGEEENQGYHTFYVEDNGIGIEQDSRQLIFEFFHREKKVTEKGYGIGLATVRKTLETAGCSIGVESVENENTKFRFTLPKAI